MPSSEGIAVGSVSAAGHGIGGVLSLFCKYTFLSSSQNFLRAFFSLGKLDAAAGQYSSRWVVLLGMLFVGIQAQYFSCVYELVNMSSFNNSKEA